MVKKYPSHYPGPLNPEIPDGCVLYYDMQDKGNKIIDQSGTGNHGIVYGAINKCGKFGNLKSFDGVDDYINIPIPKKISSLSTNFTIIAHINLPEIPSANKWIFVGGESTYGNTKHGLLVNSSGKVLFDQYLPSGGTLTSNTILTTGKDYIIAYTQKSGYRALIINGVIDIYDSSPETYTGETPQSWNICKRYSSTNSFLKAIIGHFSIYNKYISPSELKEISNNLLSKFPTIKTDPQIVVGLENWKSKLMELKNTTLNINCLGDSITAGTGAGSTLTDLWNLSWVGQLRNYYKTLYGDAGEGYRNIVWYNKPSQLYFTYNGTWNGGYNNTVEANANVVCPFTGQGVRIFFKSDTNTSDFTTQIDSETVVTQIGDTVDSKISYVDITGLSNTAHNLTITNLQNRSEGLFFYGIMELRGNNQGVRVNNFGIPSYGAYSTWGDPTKLGVILNSQLVPADLSIITIGINDKLSNITIANFKTGVNTMIDACKAQGSDVLLVVEGTTTTDGTYPWSDYVTALHEVATAKGCAILDFQSLWSGAYATYVGDTIHPDTAGHNDMFLKIKNLIKI